MLKIGQKPNKTYKSITDRKKGYIKNSNGLLICRNKEEISP